MKVEINQEQKQQLLDKLQRFFETELDSELGQFDGEFLLDLMTKELAPILYNQALYDAQALLQSKFEDISDSLYMLEK